jgi:hypothetical protein
MSEWRKVINSGSQAELESLHIQGDPGTYDIVYPGSNGPEQNFYLKSFDDGVNGPVTEPEDNPWLSETSHSNASETPWKVMYIEGSSLYVPFEVHDGGDHGGTSQTGPLGGVAWDDVDTEAQKPVDLNLPFLHADTTSPQFSSEFALVSPKIRLTENHSNSKLVFYFHMYALEAMDGEPGTLSVWVSPSAISINPSTQLQLTYFNGYYDGSGNPQYSTANDISGTQQSNQSDTYRRCEIDLDSLTLDTDQYIWIRYVGDGNAYGDLALGHIYFTTTESPPDTTVTYSTPNLKVVSDAIKFYGLPPDDPHVEGALWRDDQGIEGATKSLIQVSQG